MADRGVSFQMIAGGGGGYGSALERPAESVVEDVRFGFVSREGARRDYGVAIIENEDGSIGHDAVKTQELRAAMHNAARPRQKEREAILSAVSERLKGITLSTQAITEIEAAKQRLATIHRHLSAARIRDDASPAGKSLRNPFLNDRAMKYWDTDSIERWMMRHDFKLPEAGRN
jgi:hypothetical protein